jgi:poly-gamma-glutamate system protein
MKLYWRPGKISNASLVVLAFLAIIAIVVVETNKVVIRQPMYDEKVRAVRLQARGMDVIKREVIRLRGKLDALTDPADSGLIGVNLSPITSVVGYVEAKQTSVNPNFAAVVVDMMRRLGLGEGDRVAIGSSGSFPGLNLATLAACKAMKLRCVMISSVSSSMYGANDPRATWLDMERLAYEEGAIDVRSVAASVGGMDDNGGQLSQDGVNLILKAINRNRIPLIRTGELATNIEERLRIYREAAEGQPYKAYINVGGNEASVGSHFTKVMLRPGINRRLPRKPIQDHGVMTRMMEDDGIPAIHLSSVSRIAEKHGLLRAPKRMPPLAQGPLFFNTEYNRTLVALLLGFLVAAAILIVYFDVGKIFSRIGPRPAREDKADGVA